MFDFMNFKKQVGGIRAQFDNLNNAIEGKRKELHHLKTSPPPNTDIVNYVCEPGGLIDRLAGNYDAALEFTLNRLFRSPLCFEKVDGIGVIAATPPGVQGSHKTTEAAILFFFRDEIKKAFRAKVESMPRLENVGPCISERPALIKNAERELADLEKELEVLRSEVVASGIII